MNLDDIFAVDGQLFNSERHYLKSAAHRVSELFPNPTIVNIGIWKGASCHCMRLGAPNAKLIGIDVMGVYSVEREVQDFLKLQVIKRNSNYVTLSEPINLLFIDGGHEFEVVLNDIRIYTHHVVPGGWVIFHDSRRDEVMRAIEWTMIGNVGWEEVIAEPRVGSLQVFQRR